MTSRSSRKRKRETRNLECTLTREELLERASSLAHAVQDVEEEQDRQKEIKSQLKAELEAKEALRAKLGSVVRSRSEYRPVDVEVIFDYDAVRVQVFRTDTAACIEDRPMTESEKQLTLGDNWS